MNKKLVVIIALIAVSLVLFAGYKIFLSPSGLEGNKQVSIQVINEDKNIDQAFIYTSDHEFLLELLEDKQEKLGVKFQKSDFGTMIIAMMNYEADNLKQEYFHIYVNDKDATTGASEIPLIDGDVYKFVLQTY